MQTGADADDLFYDEERRRIYVVCGEGFVDVIQLTSDFHYEHLTRVSTAPGARTGLYVASRAALYVAAPAHSGATAAIRVYAVR